MEKCLRYMEKFTMEKWKYFSMQLSMMFHAIILFPWKKSIMSMEKYLGSME